MKTLWKKWGIVASVGVLSACVVASFHWHPFEKEEQKKPLTVEEIRQKYIDILSCVPEKPIDKKVLFAEAMKQYWQYRMDELWEHDKDISDLYGLTYTTVENHCGLKWNIFGKPASITKETCYPWMVSYKTPEELYQALLTYPMPANANGENAFRQRMYSLGGKTYNPKTDNNIYMEEQNFSIIKREGWASTYFYPADCCRLVSYGEIEREIEVLLDRKSYNYFPESVLSLSRNFLNQINFLEIHRNPLDEVRYKDGYEGLGRRLRGNNLNKDDFFKAINHVYYLYYPVSQCGKAIFHCDRNLSCFSTSNT